MKEQLLQLMESEGMTPAKFSDEIGVQRSSISHILSDRNKPSYDFIIKILNRFQEINAEWLLTGKGSMVKSSGPKQLMSIKQPSLFDQQSINANTNNTSGQMHDDKIESKVPNNKFEDKGKDQKLTDSTFNNANEVFNQVTNVNNINLVMFFYKDGTFQQYSPKK
jgi:transcriptional regulator with XRE-family HTH domain